MSDGLEGARSSGGGGDGGGDRPDGRPDRGGRRPGDPEVRLARASGIMALGTVASRVTGFLRTVAIAAAIGTGAVGDAYNVANTTPNILYDLLLGGVLSSVVVPVLVRARRDDPDGGDAFASSLLTVVAVGLGVATLVAMLAAPLLAQAYVDGPDAQQSLAVTFLRWFLPQVPFYGVGAVIGAILQTRGRFGAPTATPVLNNLVVIAVALAVMFMPGPRTPDVGTITGAQTATLGAGTTLGVVVMTLALLPALRASGFRYRPRVDLRHPGLRSAARLAGWVVLYVVVSQIGYFVVTRLATGTTAFTTYTYAYQLFQLPHAIIAVSLITALLPRMSGHAADGRLDLVRTDLSLGLRTALVVMVPSALGLLVLARPASIAVFAHGAVSVDDAARIGVTLAAFAVALVPFSTFQLQLRAFYAMTDSRTPALVQCGVVAVQVAAAAALAALLPERDRAVGLALAFALAYAVGTAGCVLLLRPRLRGVDGHRVTRTGVRALVAGVAGALLALAVLLVVRAVAGEGPAASLVAVVLGGAVGGGVYLAAALRMTDELSDVTRLVRTRLRR